jgi:hypothetical protein
MSFDTEGCSYCAEGGPRKHTDPVPHVNVDETEEFPFLCTQHVSDINISIIRSF